MLSTLTKRPSVREGRVPWDVRWVPPNSGEAEKAGEVPENRNSATNTGQSPSVDPAPKGSPFQPELWGAGTWSTDGKVSHTINNP